MIVWKTLLLVYDRIEVTYQDREGVCKSFDYVMTPMELRDGMESFRQFPRLVENLTSGAAAIECDAVRVARPLTTLSEVREHQFWPSPDDVRAELRQFASFHKFHSILVYWPQHNFQEGNSIPSDGWGYGMGASWWSHNATYATVANARPCKWQVPLAGEVWLHEWLHGTCAHFAARGYQMPKKDADGGDSHGYVRSPVTGWTDFYRDLMNCNVPEDGKLLGIPSKAWQESIT